MDWVCDTIRTVYTGGATINHVSGNMPLETHDGTEEALEQNLIPYRIMERWNRKELTVGVYAIIHKQKIEKMDVHESPIKAGMKNGGKEARVVKKESGGPFTVGVCGGDLCRGSSAEGAIGGGVPYRASIGE